MDSKEFSENMESISEKIFALYMHGIINAWINFEGKDNRLEVSFTSKDRIPNYFSCQVKDFIFEYSYNLNKINKANQEDNAEIFKRIYRRLKLIKDFSTIYENGCCF